VVETREPATETTLEDVLARNLSIRSTARTRLRAFYHPGLLAAWRVLVLEGFENAVLQSICL
jgi:hypothetical protein